MRLHERLAGTHLFTVLELASWYTEADSIEYWDTIWTEQRYILEMRRREKQFNHFANSIKMTQASTCLNPFNISPENFGKWRSSARLP